LLADLESRGGLQGQRPEEVRLDIDPNHCEIPRTIRTNLQLENHSLCVS